MADPVTLAMVGAAAGAALKPNDPLKGAMLGATAGFTGGTALGVGAAGAGAAGTAAAGGTAAGTAAAATPYAIPGIVSSASPVLAGQTAAATPYAIPGLTSAAAPVLSGQVASAPYSIPGMTGGASPAFAGTNSLSNAMSSGASGFPINPSIGQATAPSFMDKLGMSGKNAIENPMMTASALNATQGLLTPEQQPPSAPAVPIQARGQLKDYNPMASMDPYRQSVIGGQPISLI